MWMGIFLATLGRELCLLGIPSRHVVLQVTFFISDFFPSGQDLPVQYKLSGKWNPTPSDWIGLFRSNEDDVNKYVTYEWSRSPKRNLVDEAVTLETIFQGK